MATPIDFAGMKQPTTEDVVSPLLSRRQALQRSGCGMGAVALAWMMHQQQALAKRAGADGGAHFEPQARSVIFFFMQGGPSQVDLFDPKPELTKYDGKVAPFEVDQRSLNGSSRLLASPFKFRPRGQSGLEISDLLPHLAEHADDLALIRSCTSARFDHDNAILLFNSGRAIPGFPATGAWVSYGLGTENDQLPAYITMGGKGRPWAWTSGWLPPIHQATPFQTAGTPVLDLKRPQHVPSRQQREYLSFVQALNRQHRARHLQELELDARMRNFELAAAMQVSAMQSVDIKQEPRHIQHAYGLDQQETREVGTQCLLARRMVEAGVRFIQINMTNWDHHSDIPKRLRASCRQSDQPVAALLTDLKQRGLLDSTLILWSGEFGRLPTVEGNLGRDHGPHGFSLWLAGGGIKGGTVFGATDDFGYRAVEKPITQSHLHATILHQLGLDYEGLTYPFEGRDESLIGVSKARVLDEILSA